MLIFENPMQCALICSHLSDPAKRRILEALSKGPLSLEILSAVTGISSSIIKDILNEMESAGLVKVDEAEERKIKKVFARALLPLYYDGDIEGLDHIIDKASHEFLEAFSRIIEEGYDIVERAFEENEGRYTLSSIVGFCFASAFKRACKELSVDRKNDEESAMRAWIAEEAKGRKSKKH
ncbi:MAG: winged helix-turn-helix domain-containing protein [Candidatus Nezhaarchaeota archaeon]|nr:winged helix-turn-helix domain-containing protein [Candidatus Nezhaarchaeota archaeon]